MFQGGKGRVEQTMATRKSCVGGDAYQGSVTGPSFQTLYFHPLGRAAVAVPISRSSSSWEELFVELTSCGAAFSIVSARASRLARFTEAVSREQGCEQLAALQKARGMQRKDIGIAQCCRREEEDREKGRVDGGGCRARVWAGVGGEGRRKQGGMERRRRRRCK